VFYIFDEFNVALGNNNNIFQSEEMALRIGFNSFILSFNKHYKRYLRYASIYAQAQ
jgi:hypothetical protein